MRDLAERARQAAKHGVHLLEPDEIRQLARHYWADVVWERGERIIDLTPTLEAYYRQRAKLHLVTQRILHGKPLRRCQECGASGCQHCHGKGYVI